MPRPVVGRWEADRRQNQAEALTGLRGNEDRRVWEVHYHNFLRDGWSYLRAKFFVHHCTDGPECPFAFAYSRAEAHQLFARFQNVRMKVAHFPLRKHFSWFPFGVEKLMASTLGWYLFVFADKPANPGPRDPG